MVENHVQHDADAVLAQGGDELLEVLHGSHGRVDGAVIGDVVSVVPARRGEEGIEPDVVYSQGGDVVDLLDDAAQISRAVTSGVAEGLGIDLVDDACPSMTFRAPGEAGWNRRTHPGTTCAHKYALVCTSCRYAPFVLYIM